MPMHLYCNVAADVGQKQLTLTWSDGPSSFEPYQISGSRFVLLQKRAKEAYRQLTILVKQCLQFAPDDPAVRQTCLDLATNGYELSKALFPAGSEQIRRWLQDLYSDDDSVTLEMVLNGSRFVPWNVVYDREPDAKAFLEGPIQGDHWLPFWGLRFILAAGRKVDPLRRLQLDPGKVLLVIDPEIHAGLEDADKQRLDEFVKSQSATLAMDEDALAAALKAEPPMMMFWLCHATPSHLVFNRSNISPVDLLEMLENSRPAGSSKRYGVAFLNACQTAQESDEEGAFLDTLHDLHFSGLVATEEITIDGFACDFGIKFLKAFLEEGRCIGEVLHRLRLQSVPLGLLYTTYCPPGLRLRKPGSVGDSGRIGVVSTSSGRVLLSAAATAVEHKQKLPAHPYRSLNYYDREHRALFAGRDDDIERFTLLLDRIDTRMLVLHGESGVGKSSFLRAGVIPFLEEDCRGYRFVNDRADGGQDKVIFIRATNDPLTQLAQALIEFCRRPFSYRKPDDEEAIVPLPDILAQTMGLKGTPEVAALKAKLSADPTSLGRLLAALSERLPFAVVLVLDQVEEIFTLARTPADHENRRVALEAIRRALQASGEFKLIVSLRTEYYGRLVDQLRQGARPTSGIREYLLTDLDEPRLTEVIERPTSDEPLEHADEPPARKYQFRYEAGVAAEIARSAVEFSAKQQDSVLPLVQVICTQLYDTAKARRNQSETALVSRADLLAVGGVQGGLRRQVEASLQKMFAATADRTAFKRLLTQLYLRQPDGTLSTALMSAAELEKRWTGRMPFERVLEKAGEGEFRLLRVALLRIGGEQTARYVSLGHDALAKVAARWDDELHRWARVRKWVAAVAAVSVLAVILAGLSFFALQQEGEARTARDKAVKSQAEAVAAQKDAEEKKQWAEKNLRVGADILEKYVRNISKDILLGGTDLDELNAEVQKIELVYKNLLAFQSTDLEVRQGAGKALRALGMIAAVKVGSNKHEIVDWYEKAAAIFRKLIAEGPPSESLHHRLLGNVLIDLGNVYLETRDQDDKSDDKPRAASLEKARETFAEAEAAFAKAWELGIRDDLGPAEIMYFRIGLAKTHHNLGIYHQEKMSVVAPTLRKAEGDLALARYEKAQKLRVENRKLEPHKLDHLNDLISTRHQIGYLYLTKYDPRIESTHLDLERARLAYQQMEPDLDRLVKEKHHSREYQDGMAKAYLNMAIIQMKTHDLNVQLEEPSRLDHLKRAEGYAERARNRFEILAHSYPKVADYRENHYLANVNLGQVLQSQGNRDVYQDFQARSAANDLKRFAISDKSRAFYRDAKKHYSMALAMLLELPPKQRLAHDTQDDIATLKSNQALMAALQQEARETTILVKSLSADELGRGEIRFWTAAACAWAYAHADGAKLSSAEKEQLKLEAVALCFEHLEKAQIEGQLRGQTRLLSLLRSGFLFHPIRAHEKFASFLAKLDKQE